MLDFARSGFPFSSSRDSCARSVTSRHIALAFEEILSEEKGWRSAPNPRHNCIIKCHRGLGAGPSGQNRSLRARILSPPCLLYDPGSLARWPPLLYPRTLGVIAARAVTTPGVAARRRHFSGLIPPSANSPLGKAITTDSAPGKTDSQGA